MWILSMTSFAAKGSTMVATPLASENESGAAVQNAPEGYLDCISNLSWCSKLSLDDTWNVFSARLVLCLSRAWIQTSFFLPLQVGIHDSKRRETTPGVVVSIGRLRTTWRGGSRIWKASQLACEDVIPLTWHDVIRNLGQHPPWSISSHQSFVARANQSSEPVDDLQEVRRLRASWRMMGKKHLQVEIWMMIFHSFSTICFLLV